jgi:hypothetical protein
MIKVIYTNLFLPVYSAFKSYAERCVYITGSGEVNIDRGVEGSKLCLNAGIPC